MRCRGCRTGRRRRRRGRRTLHCTEVLVKHHALRLDGAIPVVFERVGCCRIQVEEVRVLLQVGHAK